MNFERAGIQPSLPMPLGMDRDAIINLVLREEYGYLPGKPLQMEAKTVNCNTKFCAGKATLSKIMLSCTMENGVFEFPIYCSFPVKRSKPAPCFILANFRDNVPDEYLPSEELVDAGYAVISFCYTDITSDDPDFTDKLAGVVYPNGRQSPHDCGKIGLWSWAASRIMDYCMTLDVLDHSRISIVGHSRLGKTALLTGVLDTRFCCAFVNNSGSCGAALARGKQGENIQKIYDRFGYWFNQSFEKYKDREDELPFDQHYLLAAMCPRRVYVASAAEDLWADPKNEFLSCVAASPFFESNGVSGLIGSNELPKVGDYFHGGNIGYHLRSGGHYLSREDWQKFIEYCT